MPMAITWPSRFLVMRPSGGVASVSGMGPSWGFPDS
jgi:hypothetical protein